MAEDHPPVVRVVDDVLEIAGRRYPWAELRIEDYDFAQDGIDLPTLRYRHAWVRLENGYTVSINWGSGAHGSNGFLYDFTGVRDRRFTEEPHEVEVGILRSGDESMNALVGWRDEDGDRDTVYSYVEPVDVNTLIDWVSSWPSGLTEAPDVPPIYVE
jgi:hypothetical protein